MQEVEDAAEDELLEEEVGGGWVEIKFDSSKFWDGGKEMQFAEFFGLPILTEKEKKGFTEWGSRLWTDSTGASLD